MPWLLEKKHKHEPTPFPNFFQLPGKPGGCWSRGRPPEAPPKSRGKGEPAGICWVVGAAT